MGVARRSVDVEGVTMEIVKLSSPDLQVELTNFGARLISIKSKNRAGVFGHVLHGYKDLASYVKDRDTYTGAICGRYANRIEDGKFKLNGEEYQLARNNGDNCLHGGKEGFDRKLWSVSVESEVRFPSVTFSYLSPAMEENFPSEMQCMVTYSLVKDNELQLCFNIACNGPNDTVHNLTSHAYFNLNDQCDSHTECVSGTDSHVPSIEDHEALMESSSFLKINASMIPEESEVQVSTHPNFDFSGEFRSVKHSHLIDVDPQLQIANGFDHYWFKYERNGYSKAIQVRENNSGRSITVYTDMPGFHFYTGNYLTNDHLSINGSKYQPRSAFAIETQFPPNSPNTNPSPVTLKPNETFVSKTSFVFDVQH